MQEKHHLLLSPALGTQRSLLSLHYGRAGVGQKVYLQASLHADELPGMLVLHHLRGLLDAAEKRGDILGEVVIVPVANPIGLDQTLMHYQAGRFELASMENFNRHYPNFYALLADHIEPQLGQDTELNKRAIRAAMHQVLQAQKPQTELESLRQTLMSLALDADVVLDLHCDYEAVMHLYVEEPMLDQAQALYCYLGAKAVLYSQDSGVISFDESLSKPWWQLQKHFPNKAIPLACLSVTVELRSQTDVYHHYAKDDALNIYHYLQYMGVIAGRAPAVPAAPCQATPLAGTEALCAPHSGLIVFVRDVGERIRAGDTVAHIIDPLTNSLTEIKASVAGIMYARHNLRFATNGMEVARIAGDKAFRTGNLFSP